MPSRIIHDLLRHILETSEVHMQNEPIHEYTVSGFQRLYMGHFPQQITLRRHIRHSEIDDLPIDIYQELIQHLSHWVRTGTTITVSRRYQNVRLAYMDLVPSPVTFGNDIRLEFFVDAIDTDYWEREIVESRERVDRYLNRVSYSDPVHVEVESMIVAEHFDEDLFEL